MIGIDFGDFKINGLPGLYIPKPRPDFYDANLNPSFIRNRVVTIVFVHTIYIVSCESKAQFF